MSGAGPEPTAPETVPPGASPESFAPAPGAAGPHARDKRPRLKRPERAGAAISLTPLVDVLLILVVFFLVTSTYLDLDMIPMVETADAPPEAAEPGAAADAGEAAPGRAGIAQGGGALLLRLAADGSVRLGGRTLEPDALAAAVAERLAARPGAEVLILPSPYAPAQALVTALDAVAAGGATHARVVRLAAPESG